MRFRRTFLLSVAAAIVALSAAARPACAQVGDVLYVGDGDNTVKRFDAASGIPLDAADSPFVSGLSGPRTLLVSEGRLLVANQNVGLQIPGEILMYHAPTGTPLGALVTAENKKDAPFVPWGMVRGGDDLFVSSLSTASGKSHGEILRYDAFDGTLSGIASTREIKNKEMHPRSMVFGPDGLLYVSFRTLRKDGLGGGVLRFYPDGASELFIDDEGGAGRLNRPDGIVFDPAGEFLYVMSFRAGPGDADAIRIYDADGQLVGKIDLFDPVAEPRRFAQSLLFGPGGRLYVPISNTGEVRAYDVETGLYDVAIPAAADGGQLSNPIFLTFGKTNPSTLKYEP